MLPGGEVIRSLVAVSRRRGVTSLEVDCWLDFTFCFYTRAGAPCACARNRGGFVDKVRGERPERPCFEEGVPFIASVSSRRMSVRAAD